MAIDHEDKRLDRIEEKLDRLTDAIVAIARAEEKLVVLEKERATMIARVESIDVRIKLIEAESNQGRGILKVLWPFWTAIIAAGATYIGIKH